MNESLDTSIVPTLEQLLPPRVRDERAEMYILTKVDMAALEADLALDLEWGNYKPEFSRALARLVYELLPRLHTYDRIIVDDASARLIGNVFEKIVATSRHRRGLPPARIDFVTLGHVCLENQQIAEIVNDYMDELPRDNREGVFILTEHIASGKSLSHWCAKLETNGVRFDIGALTISPELFCRFLSGEWKPAWANADLAPLARHLRYGSRSAAGLVLHKDIYSYTGIRRRTPEDPPGLGGISSEAPEMSRLEIGRQTVARLSKHLIPLLG